MSYIGNAPVVQASRVTTELVAIAGQTDIYPLGGYTPGDYLDVEINGSALKSTDYTATDGVKITLAVAMAAGDDVRVKAFGVFQVANAVPANGSVSATKLDVASSNGTGASSLPSGTTAQRPSLPSTGMQRYNTSLKQIEAFNGSAWVAVGDMTSTYSVGYLLLGGGAGGGYSDGGGGGAGGFIESTAVLTAETVYAITVGAGGSAGTSGSTKGGNGVNSSFVAISAIGGGGGAGVGNSANSGGSGGGGCYTYTSAEGAGTSGQGYGGGHGNNYVSGSGSATGGGGGGAGGAGGAGVGGQAGVGGAGKSSSITGSAVTYGGGGGGGAYAGLGGAGGAGGGGQGGGTSGPQLLGGAGAANTGGGGGGGADSNSGGAGGSGVVVLSVPTTRYSGITTGSPTVTTSGSNTILKFTTSGSYTA